MAHSPSEQPDSSGLQVVEPEMQSSAPEATFDGEEKQVNTRLVTDHYAQDKTIAPDEKFPVTSPMVDSQKIANPSGAPHRNLEPDSHYDQRHQYSDQSSQNKFLPHTRRGRRRLWIILALALVVIVIAIAVPCGVIFSRRSQQSSTNLAPTSSNDTNTGSAETTAMNGTQFGTFQPAGSTNEIWLFWQNAAGDVRMTQHSEQGNWLPSISMNITDAINNTALALGVHVWQGKPAGLYHLVYQANDGNYADIINDPTTGSSWRDGGLHDLQRGFPPSTARSYSTWASYDNGTAFLYAGGSNAGWYQEWVYEASTVAWQTGRWLFSNSSCFGGISAAQEVNNTAIHLVNQKNEIVSYYRDLSNPRVSENDIDSEDRSPQQWSNVNQPIDGLWPNTSLAQVHGPYADPLLTYYQDSSGSISVAQSSGYTPGSRWVGNSQTNMVAMGGSALNVIAISDGSSVNNHMFFQQKGNDIAHYAGNKTDWTFVESVPLN